MADVKQQEARVPRAPTMLQSMIPLLFLVVAIGLAVYLYGDDSIFGPVQVALVLSAMLAGQIGYWNGHTIEKIMQSAVASISTAIGAIFILFAVGSLIGTWNMSGTIATLTDWGVNILSASWFYVAAALICAIIAVGIGSSWTVIGTIGVALLGIGTALGVSPEITAGAVISGAYFGDKMSPLSETTNLAPAVAGTDLYSHIRSMAWTTFPSIIIALIIFAFLGLRENVSDSNDIAVEFDSFEGVMNTGVIFIIPLLVVVILAVRKIPPALSIMAGALTAGLIAVLFNYEVVEQFVDDAELNGFLTALKGVWDAMATGYVPDTGTEALDGLLGGGGMAGMMNTVWLILTALAFGGIMDYTGMLGRLIDPMVRRAKTDKGIVASTGATAIGVNIVAADQYLSIVLTGNTFKTKYEQLGIAPQTLSRQVEDTGTVTSVLVPWNSCGAFVAGTLGVETIAYLPYAFFNWINPIISFIYAFTGFRIQKVEPEHGFKKTPHDGSFYGVGGQHPDELPFHGDEEDVTVPTREDREGEE